MKILVAGDFCDRYRVSESIANNDYASMFDGIKPVVSSCDFSVVNFEFPILFGQDSPILKCGPNLKGQPDAVEAIKYAGFNICTLANNHILDQGIQNCLLTKRHIESSGLKTVGAGKDIDDASAVLFCSKDDQVVAFINCCEHEFSVASRSCGGACPLNPVRQFHSIQEAREKADFVIVIVHGGHECFKLPSPRMKEIYRFFIEAGADAVINHHQHCFSGYEFYKGKPIVYGLGNLLFDNPDERDGQWNRGYMAVLNLENNGQGISMDLLPYTQCNEHARVDLMEASEKDAFYGEIGRLNHIIQDDDALAEMVDEYYSSSIALEQRILEPYSRKLFLKLFSHGLMPRLVMRGSKKYQIINHIECESHRDKLLFSLKRCK